MKRIHKYITRKNWVAKQIASWNMHNYWPKAQTKWGPSANIRPKIKKGPKANQNPPGLKNRDE